LKDDQQIAGAYLKQLNTERIIKKNDGNRKDEVNSSIVKVTILDV
jgi:hypothetical protein